VPKEAKPDKKPEVPAQQNELQQRDADEHIPIACGSQIPASPRHHVPGGGPVCEAAVPDPKAEAVDDDKERDLDKD